MPCRRSWVRVPSSALTEGPGNGLFFSFSWPLACRRGCSDWRVVWRVELARLSWLAELARDPSQASTPTPSASAVQVTRQARHRRDGIVLGSIGVSLPRQNCQMMVCKRHAPRLDLGLRTCRQLPVLATTSVPSASSPSREQSGAVIRGGFSKASPIIKAGGEDSCLHEASDGLEPSTPP